LAASSALAALLATAPAKAADEVTSDRLINADKEQGNWLLPH
jgi:alcohol dehydrogenase (cytochrome c)